MRHLRGKQTVGEYAHPTECGFYFCTAPNDRRESGFTSCEFSVPLRLPPRRGKLSAASNSSAHREDPGRRKACPGVKEDRAQQRFFTTEARKHRGALDTRRESRGRENQ